MQPCRGARAVFEFVGGERHRANLSWTARRRRSSTDARWSAVILAVSVGNAEAISSNATTLLLGVGAVLGTDATQDHRTVAKARSVKPIGHPGIASAYHHSHQAVGIHHRLMCVQAGLVTAVVNRLPPRVAERIAPVNPLGWFNFEDQRLFRVEFPSPDHGLVLRGRAYRGAIDRRQKAVRRRRRTELQEEVEIVVHEIAECDQLPRHHHVGIDVDGLRPHRITDPFDAQGRRRLGVPVVEEVPNGQRRMGTVDRHPVTVVFVGGQHHLEVAVAVGDQLVDQSIRGGGDAIHRLQPDIPCGATVAGQSIALPTAHRRAGVQTVRTFHPPGEDVAGAGALDAQNRIGIESQRLVDTSGQQHQQMPHSRREIDPISACGIGFDDLRGSVELVASDATTPQASPRHRPPAPRWTPRRWSAATTPSMAVQRSHRHRFCMHS